MRGKIIHYNSVDGKGLVSADLRQFAFEITQWRSDVAPDINQVVDLTLAGDALASVTRVSEDILLKERAERLASKLGTAGGAALQSLKDANASAGQSPVAGAVRFLGKPLLIAYGVFAFAALWFAHYGLAALQALRKQAEPELVPAPELAQRDMIDVPLQLPPAP